MIGPEDGDFDGDVLELINAKPFGLAEGLLLVWLMEIFGFGIKNEILEKILFSVALGVYSSISPF
jgi:hypothetical protein